MKIDRKRLRYLVATLLARLPGQCWTDLVRWVEYQSDGPREIRRRSPWSPIDSVCRMDAARNGRCYCGKVGAPATKAGPR